MQALAQGHRAHSRQRQGWMPEPLLMAMLSAQPAGSCHWPPTTVTALSRCCVPDRPPTPSPGGAQGTQPSLLGLLSQGDSGR